MNTVDPPVNVEAEEALLGCLLMKGELLGDIHVSDQDFSSRERSYVYAAMRDLHRDGKPVDIVTLSERLRKHGALKDVGGSAYLAELTQTVATTIHAQHYAEIVAEKGRRRRILQATEDMQRTVENVQSTPEDIERAVAAVNAVTTTVDTSAPAPVSLAEIWDTASDEGFKGLSTGYPSLDEMTQGMAPGQVHVYFGDTGHGKSQMVQNIAVKVAEAGHPVLFVGLEMTKEENRDRFKSFGAHATTPIYQPPQIDLDYKVLESQIAAQEYELVIVDHLHMFENQGHDGEANFLSAVCREVKMLAIKYDVPIILVSHINEDKQRSGPPKLSDLKGSSSIKQIADVAISVYNPEMVSSDLDDIAGEQMLTLQLRKNRRGRKRLSARLRILPDARLVEPTPAPSWSGPTVS